MRRSRWSRATRSRSCPPASSGYGSYQVSAECDLTARTKVAHTECEPSQSYYTDELTGIDAWDDLALDDMGGEGAAATTSGSTTPPVEGLHRGNPRAALRHFLHTNDVHCGVDETFDKEGNATSIGYAGVSTIKKEAETTYGAGNVALVDAGDAVQGKPIGTLLRRVVPGGHHEPGRLRRWPCPATTNSTTAWTGCASWQTARTRRTRRATSTTLRPAKPSSPPM